MRHRIMLVLCLLALAPRAHAQVVPLGPEFHIMTSSTAFGPRVAVDDEGRFLAGFYDVFEGRIGLRGWDRGQLQDSFEIAPGARYAAIAELGSGDFAVTWSLRDPDEFQWHILLQAFAVDGTPLTSPAQVNVDPSQGLGSVTAVARRPDDLMVVWNHTTDAVANREIRGRFLPWVGSPGPPFTVSIGPVADSIQPRVAATADGRTLVVWRDQECAPEDPSDGCIRGRHYTAAGNPTGGELLINSFTTGVQSQPAVAAADDGFLVAWESLDCGDECIRVRRFDADATALAAELRADLTGADFVNSPSVGATGSGEFVVAWARWLASDALTYARAFDRSGRPLTSELRVNSDPSSEPSEVAAAINDDGQFVVVWSDNYDMWGRRFELELTLFEDGFESGDTSAWSAAVPQVP